MAATDLKRSLLSNTSCFSNLYLFECIRKFKSKSYLNFIMMTMGKDLNLTKKKLDCLRMKMCKGVRLRRVKIKGLVHNRLIRENTIPIDLSSKHEVCFMIKSTFVTNRQNDIMCTDIMCNSIRLPNEDLWHQRMGHASYKHISIVSKHKSVLGISKPSKESNVVCGPC